MVRRGYVYLYFFFGFVFCAMSIVIYTHIVRHQPILQKDQVCSHHTCGAIDPVSDPAYNMKNVIQQTILLEEHLAEDNKYCKDCIVKHFLHIIGLLEEAIWLACKNVDKYPCLKESLPKYESMFDEWLAQKDDKEYVKVILEKLRDWRKQLVVAYYNSQ